MVTEVKVLAYLEGSQEEGVYKGCSVAEAEEKAEVAQFVFPPSAFVVLNSSLPHLPKYPSTVLLVRGWFVGVEVSNLAGIPPAMLSIVTCRRGPRSDEKVFGVPVGNKLGRPDESGALVEKALPLQVEGLLDLFP